jgi:type I restriction enzyme R subunit
MSKTRERDFEDAVEGHLVTSGGWRKGHPRDFDRETALVSKDLFAFIEATQPETWTEFRKHHQSGLEAAVLDTLLKALDSRGELDVLRHGFKFFGKKIECAYFKPAHGMNPDILAKYAQNRMVVTRQVRFEPDGDESVDLVLFVNGFPVATAELKNPLTNQTVQDAVAQYRRRDPRHPLLRFKTRALVHFAVDPDLVYMTTKLLGEKTSFLPFNRGHNGGAGNPEHESGYRTGYLWQEVWQRDSFLDILGRFVHVAVEESKVDGKTVTKESVVFPRYHQLDAVR